MSMTSMNEIDFGYRKYFFFCSEITHWRIREMDLTRHRQDFRNLLEAEVSFLLRTRNSKRLYPSDGLSVGP